MNEIENPSFNAQKCSSCAGIWFKDGSHQVAKLIKGIDKIDSPKPNSDVAYNDVRDIDCPECSQKMFKMVDSSQLHIQFEACADCDGVFFDAGEITDLSNFSILEQIKQAVETFRTNAGV